MKELFTDSIDEISKMTSRERNFKLCELATKDHLGSIMPHETAQLLFIQMIRTENGEIETVLRNWAEHPELDPRKQ